MIEKNSEIINKVYPLANLEYNVSKKILYFRITQDIDIDIPEINEMIRYAQEMVGDVPHYGIVNFGMHVGSTNEARKIYADSDYIQKNRVADAFVVESLALKLIANFFIKVTKPKVPTRMFNTELDAVNWIYSLVQKEVLV
jgi:hypothetical protein